MTLIELIPFLRNENALEKLIKEKCPELYFDEVEIYMIEKIGWQSKLSFFDQNDERVNLAILEINGIGYFNLFHMCHLLDIFDDYNLDGNSDTNIAKEIIQYRINDA